MPGYLLHLGATVTCMHSGIAQPVMVNPRVKVNGQPIVVQTSSYAIAGCSLIPSGNPFCATAQWLSAAARVKSNGVPVILQDSQSVCQPSGTGLLVQMTQLRVKGM
jgi:uncharacterized Zn-binding protein involved in type VI secretion